jgi:hypothetical protein
VSLRVNHHRFMFASVADNRLMYLLCFRDNLRPPHLGWRFGPCAERTFASSRVDRNNGVVRRRRIRPKVTVSISAFIRKGPTSGRPADVPAGPTPTLASGNKLRAN